MRIEKPGSKDEFVVEADAIVGHGKIYRRGDVLSAEELMDNPAPYLRAGAIKRCIPVKISQVPSNGAFLG